MAEILVSDLRADRPPLLAVGRHSMAEQRPDAGNGGRAFA
jgi:hypothetical protein